MSFEAESAERVASWTDETPLVQHGNAFLAESAREKYSYNFSWLGRPIIQYPQDIVAVQELIWSVKPDLIVETGIAHGGSLILSASILAMLDYAEALAQGTSLNPAHPKRHVLGIDIDIREHNRAAIEAHPMCNRIEMIEGSAISPQIVSRVAEQASRYERVMVLLDSNHTHEHVLAELQYYTPLVSRGSYCIVYDTLIEEMPEDCYPDRPWGPGNSPKTAVQEFLQSNSQFEIDNSIDRKLIITVASGGFLKRK